MIRHGNHVCYLQHRLRGLYDTYPGTRFDPLPDYGDIGGRVTAEVHAEMARATGCAA